ncbi:MAG: glutathione peroxidase [Pseudomonadota bacterium]
MLLDLIQPLRIIRLFCALILIALCLPALAVDRDTPFSSIDGGTLSIRQWEGQPVLVVNTASLCGFSDQFRDLQTLYDRYRDDGLVVLAIPSDDFNQELGSNAEVKDYCELTYGIDLPMTEITPVLGSDAHPFYQSVRAESGFVPRWNFNKILLDQQGDIVATFAARVAPMSVEITREIDTLLGL